MTTQQGLRQQSVRNVTGTALDYNGDWSELFDLAGIATTKTWNGRMLDWINLQLSTSYIDLSSAMAAFAANQSATTWSAIGTFNAATGSYLLLVSGGNVLLTNGVDSLLIV